MIKSKKQMFVVIGVFTLVMLLSTVTYAFFNYTRTGEANNIRTGRIYFNSTQNNTLNMTNAFPMTSTEAGNANLDTVTLGIIGDTTYADGEEFEITLVDVNNTINNKEVPMNFIATYTANTGGSIGASSDSYWTARNSKNANIYTLTSSGEVSEGKEVLVGYIKSGETGINGTLSISAYIDADRVAISDTYYGNAPSPSPSASPITGPNNEYGTTIEWVNGRTVFTTTEWNSIASNPVSFKIKAESQEGIWVEDHTPICKRVTNIANLHTEECSQTSNYCYADGYTGANNIITYGNAKSSGSSLAVGDAFDCKVSSNGDYTERFYYVSPYYNTATQAFDNSYATLIYYSNTISGVASDGGSEYYASSYENWHGPITAKSNLPTTSQWNNIELKTTSRTIKACDNSDCSNLITETTGSGRNQIENPFSYAGYAARLLTIKELKASGCESLSGMTSLDTVGVLKQCNFLMEGTKYANSSKSTSSIWLETVRESDYGSAWAMETYRRNLIFSDSRYTFIGARPVIEIPYSRLEY